MGGPVGHLAACPCQRWRTACRRALFRPFLFCSSSFFVMLVPTMLGGVRPRLPCPPATATTLVGMAALMQFHIAPAPAPAAAAAAAAAARVCPPLQRRREERRLSGPAAQLLAPSPAAKRLRLRQEEQRHQQQQGSGGGGRDGGSATPSSTTGAGPGPAAGPSTGAAAAAAAAAAGGADPRLSLWEPPVSPYGLLGERKRAWRGEEEGLVG